MIQTFIHYGLHFAIPFLIAFFFFRKEWQKVYFILLATMLVDLDHLLATPIFQANRCSIGFHYLHTFPAIIFYFFLIFFKKPFRIIGIGLLFHMLTDLIDCLFIYKDCPDCTATAPAKTLLTSLSNLLGL